MPQRRGRQNPLRHGYPAKHSVCALGEADLHAPKRRNAASREHPHIDGMITHRDSLDTPHDVN
jgi:hypothetical protein